MTVLCSSVLCVSLLDAPAASAATSAIDGPATVLSLTSYADMVADPVHGHLFISGGTMSPYIQVVSTSTDTLGTIPVADVTGLVLSPDGSRLYAASADDDRIVAISTSTLAVVASYPTGDSAPYWLAFAGGRLWFSGGATMDLGWLNPATGQVTVTKTQAPNYAVALTSSPAAPNMLVAGTLGVSPSVIDVYNVSTGTPVYVSGIQNVGYPNGQDPCDSLQDLAITANGADVLLACGSRSQLPAYTLSTFASAGPYDLTGPYPLAVAVASSGQVAVGVCNGDGTSAIDVFNPGNATPVAQATDPDFNALDVAWDGTTTVYAVTNTQPSDTYTLREYTL
jgi:YVTN family beta-propeller protein